MSVTSKNGTRAQKTADDDDAMRRKSEELSVKCSERGTRERERDRIGEVGRRARAVMECDGWDEEERAKKKWIEERESHENNSVTLASWNGGRRSCQIRGPSDSPALEYQIMTSQYPASLKTEFKRGRHHHDLNDGLRKGMSVASSDF